MDYEIVQPQPQSITVPLFEHQLKSMKSMYELESSGKVSLSNTDFLSTSVGCLSDIGGYGKTLSVLALIAKTQQDELLDEENTYHHHPFEIRFHKYVQRISVISLKSVRCSLVVVNVSLLTQWQQELNRTTLRYRLVHTKSELDQSLQLSDYDVIIVSSTVYNLFVKVHLHTLWKRLIIDEPASIGTNLEKCHANFYWLITATPEELLDQKQKGLLLDLIPTHQNDFLPLILRNEEEFIKKSYNMPNTYYHRYNCYSISSFFRDIVNRTVFEMLESGDVVGAVSFYGGKDDTSIYDAYIQKKQKKINELSLLGGSMNTSRMSELRKDITTLQERLPRDCSTVLSCCHQFYYKGIIEICPYCKEPNPTLLQVKEGKDYDYCHNRVEEEEEHCIINQPHKIDTLMSIITNKLQDPSNKILIYSNHNETFNVIKRFLPEHSFLELKGTKSSRDNTLEAYKTGDVNILLLNTLSSGSGLNLPETTDIIIYHTVSEFINSQVISRALRIGRTKKLDVHYL